MVAIQVCRDPQIPNGCQGDDPVLKWGRDISDVLLTTDAAAVERGRVEIDRQYTNRKMLSLQLHNIVFRQPGALLAVTEDGITQGGLLKNVTVNINRQGETLTVGTNMVLECNE